MTEEHHGEHHHTEHKHTEHNHTEHEHMGQHHTEHKGHNHAEHEHIDHSTHKSSKVKKATVWKWVSIALGILLITSLYFNFSNKGIGVTGDTVPIDKATDEAVDYINTYLLQPGTTAILNSKSDVGELYKIDIGIDGQQYESYITKDGKMFFTSGIDMTETPDAAPNQPAQPVEVQDVDIGDSASKGKGDAKVTIVEYSSFSCGWCNRVRTTLDQIMKTYPDDVKIVYKHFDRGGTDSKAGQAAECASEQGKFWEMHDVLFDKGSSGDLEAYAGEIGLDTTAFKECLDSGKYASKITQNTQEGRSFGIRGTPGFMVNGQLVSGAQPFENFQQIIEAELAK